MESNEQTLKNIILLGKDIKINKQQLIAISVLSAYFFTSLANFSCITPFFPEEAIKKGMNLTEIGIIFGVFQLIFLIFAPIFGKYVIL